MKLSTLKLKKLPVAIRAAERIPLVSRPPAVAGWVAVPAHLDNPTGLIWVSRLSTPAQVYASF
jgi:hypothetical protein